MCVSIACYVMYVRTHVLLCKLFAFVMYVSVCMGVCLYVMCVCMIVRVWCYVLLYECITTYVVQYMRGPM